MHAGKVFDSTREDNTVFSFEVGKGSVIRAWDIAIKTMQVGEIACITCQPDYAYGQAGSPPEIPSGATLVFEIELLGARPPRGSTLDSVAAEKAKLEEVRKERDLAAVKKEEEKKKREEAKAAAAARMQAKMDSKKGGGKGNKGKGKWKLPYIQVWLGTCLTKYYFHVIVVRFQPIIWWRMELLGQKESIHAYLDPHGGKYICPVYILTLST